MKTKKIGGKGLGEITLGNFLSNIVAKGGPSYALLRWTGPSTLRFGEQAGEKSHSVRQLYKYIQHLKQLANLCRNVYIWIYISRI
ncbi:MAG TPA: hypothetical protein ENI57_11385 [Ignavibacteria bacterium]|nr:hypothetical protein [Ignavibacteria bacterium]